MLTPDSLRFTSTHHTADTKRVIKADQKLGFGYLNTTEFMIGSGFPEYSVLILLFSVILGSTGDEDMACNKIIQPNIIFSK